MTIAAIPRGRLGGGESPLDSGLNPARASKHSMCGWARRLTASWAKSPQPCSRRSRRPFFQQRPTEGGGCRRPGPLPALHLGKPRLDLGYGKARQSPARPAGSLPAKGRPTISLMRSTPGRRGNWLSSNIHIGPSARSCDSLPNVRSPPPSTQLTAIGHIKGEHGQCCDRSGGVSVEKCGLGGKDRDGNRCEGLDGSKCRSGGISVHGTHWQAE